MPPLLEVVVYLTVSYIDQVHNRASIRFGDTVRSKREELGLRLADVATPIGIRGEFLSLVETGKRNLHLDRVPALASVLGLDPVELCGLAMAAQFPAAHAVLFGGKREMNAAFADLPFGEEIWLLPPSSREAIFAVAREIINLHWEAGRASAAASSASKE